MVLMNLISNQKTDIFRVVFVAQLLYRLYYLF